MRLRAKITTYEALVSPHLDRLYAYARRRVATEADADDLVQETLLRGWQRFRQLRDPAALRTWLYRILTSLSAEQGRTKRRRMALVPITQLEDKHDELVASMRPGPLEELMAQQSSDAVHRALAALPEDFATAVELHDIDGFRYREIAEIIQVPVGTVMSRISRGRRLLAGMLYEWAEQSVRDETHDRDGTYEVKR